MPLLPRAVCDRVANDAASFLRSYDRGGFGTGFRPVDGVDHPVIADLRRLLTEYRSLPPRAPSMCIVSYADLDHAGIPGEPARRSEATPPRLDPTEIPLTPAVAETLLLPGMAIHVMVGRRGDRWTRGQAVGALRAARTIRLTDPATWSTGFGLAVDRDSGESVLMTAEIPKVRVWLERQAAEGVE